MAKHNLRWWFDFGISHWRSRLAYIVLLMSVALVCLVALQFYWLDNAIQLKEEQFKALIMSSLDNIVRKLEHREILHVTARSVRNGAIGNKATGVRIDSSGRVHWEEDEIVTIRQVLSNADLSRKGMAIAIEEEARISRSGMATNLSTDEKISLSVEPQKGENEANPLFDSLEYLRKRKDQQLLKLINRDKLVAMVVQNMVNFDTPIEERINKKLLDSLLYAEMQAHGINIAYEFVVIEAPKQRLVFADSVSDKLAAVRSPFRVKLFPNDEYADRSYLCVYFPQQRQYMLRSMKFILGTSVLLIAVITFCFGFAIFTIIRQKKLSEMKNDFINNMTHEFKTPVSTIALACEMLADEDVRQNDQLLARYMQIIKDENNRMGAQVENVLQIARLDKGDFKLMIEPIDLHELIQRAVYNIEIQIENRNGVIIMDLAAKNSMIEADEMHLTNIIHNLLDNANKYSPENPEIRITTENSDKGVIISISDKGQGIANDLVNKIFDKFYRVPTGNLHDVKGFGLGLSYVKTMVYAHHGSISVQSELTKGSTFYIFFPFKHETQ